MKLPIIPICFFLSFINFSTSVNLDCIYYQNHDFKMAGTIYYCYVKNKLNIVSPNSVVLDTISGSHHSGNTNNDVVAFASHEKGIQYFPRGVENIIKNLTVIYILNGRLKAVFQADLQPFNKLIHLNLQNNDIEIVEDGLFAYNPDLAYIDISSNKIVHISSNVFDNLAKLTYLFLKSNPCLSMDASNNSTAVREVINQVKNKCQDTNFLSLSDKLKSLKEESKNLNFDGFQAFKDKLESFDNQLKTSKFSTFPSLLESLQDLKNVKIERPQKTKTEAYTIPSVQDTKPTDIKNTSDTCLNLESKFYGLEKNLKALFHEHFNNSNDGHETCKNETFSLFNGELVSLDGKLSAQNEKIVTIDKRLSNFDVKITSLDEKMTTVVEKLSIFDDQANFYEKIASFDEKLLNFDKKLSIFDDKFSVFDEKFATLDEKLTDFDEKLSNLGEKTTIYEEYLGEFQGSMAKKLATMEFEIKETRFKMLKSNELRHGQLEARIMKKIESIEKLLEEKIEKIIKALNI